ncbi:MAG: acyltransferase family protein, partial [Mycobacteriales bacterium]
MPRVTWVNNLSDIRAAAAYFENWQLGYHAVNYLAASNSPTVVQHYWSLSVEEQFYLVWPLLVLLAVAVSRRLRGVSFGALLGVVLATAAAASLVVSALWTAGDPAMAFFATPARAWEFAAGGLVAVALPRLDRMPAGTRAALSWLGLLVVVVSMFAITPRDAFPGLVALAPVLGAVMVIAPVLTEHTRWSPRGVLSWRPVQWVGDESYAIYLWHWPLIIAAPWVIERPVDWSARVVILLASLVLAGLTTRLVENPVRRGARWRARRWPAYALAAAGVAVVTTVSADVITQVDRHEHRLESVASVRSAAVVVRPHRHSCYGAAAMIAANHCVRPFARPKHLDTAFAAQDGGGDPCLQSQLAPTTPEFCSFGEQRHPTETLAIIGNSHAWRLVPALALYAQHHHWRIIEAARVNCLGLITAPVSTGGASRACLAWTAQVRAHLLAMRHLDGVIFASYRFWEEFTTGPNPTRLEVAGARRQILQSWSEFAARKVQVFVAQDVPGMRPVLDPKCIQLSRRDYDPCAQPTVNVVRPTIVTELAHQYPSLATYLPLDQFFCDVRLCHGLIGGVVVYFDAHHLTSTYSRTLAEYLGAEITAGLAR